MEMRAIAADLIRGGDSLWSSVECEMKRDRVIVYARLSAHQPHDVHHALVESERVFNAVLAGRDWLAAVHWSDRLCRTFRSGPSGVEPAS